MRHWLVVALVGAALRESLPLLRRLADALDPAGNVAEAWAVGGSKCPDYLPEHLLRDQR